MRSKTIKKIYQNVKDADHKKLIKEYYSSKRAFLMNERVGGGHLFSGVSTGAVEVGAGAAETAATGVASTAAAAAAITGIVFGAPIALTAYSLKGLGTVRGTIEFDYRMNISGQTSGEDVNGDGKESIVWTKAFAKGTKMYKVVENSLPLIFTYNGSLRDKAVIPHAVGDDVEITIKKDGPEIDEANDIIALINEGKLDLHSLKKHFLDKFKPQKQERGGKTTVLKLKEPDEDKPDGDKEDKTRSDPKPKPKKGGGNSKVKEIQKIVGANPDGVWGPETEGKIYKFVSERVTAMEVDSLSLDMVKRGQDKGAIKKVLTKLVKESWKNNIGKTKSFTVNNIKTFTPSGAASAYKPTLDGMLSFIKLIDDASEGKTFKETLGPGYIPESRANLYRKRYRRY